MKGSRRDAERELARIVIAQADAPADLMRYADARPMSWGHATTVNDAIAGWRLNGWDDLSPTTTRRYEVDLASTGTRHDRPPADRRPHPVGLRAVLPQVEGPRPESGERALRPTDAAPGMSVGPEVERRRTSQPGGRHGDARVALRRAGRAGPGAERRRGTRDPRGSRDLAPADVAVHQGDGRVRRPPGRGVRDPGGPTATGRRGPSGSTKR